ncbi:hypothetical protein ONZ43_g244 [Nemania bipapillata]|uniref:Uncharacterized protein n=1 Tax=Nemania bipapillata TaxID=110536 RepID=A0ACC2J8Z7_9PEZI|nr:hypothetical protein ONZ43_g244 [Nemania bipapillata]
MTLGTFNDPEQRAGWIIAIVTAPIGIAAAVFRFLATRRAKRKLSWDDWLALLALVSFLPYIGYALWVFTIIDGLPVALAAMKDPQLAIQVLKVGNIMNILYAVQQCFVKYSLLALYYRLFWVNANFNIGVWVLAGFQTAWGLTVLLIHLLACKPLEKLWNPTLQGHCININIAFSIYEPINSFLDFLAAALAMWMLPALHLKTSTRWHLAGLFVIGAFCLHTSFSSGVIGIIKVVEAQNSAQHNFLLIIWNMVQMVTSLRVFVGISKLPAQSAVK